MLPDDQLHPVQSSWFRPVAKRLMELNSGDCRFPVQEVPNISGRYLFCAAPVVPGRAYCTEHWKICNTTRQPSGGRAPKV